VRVPAYRVEIKPSAERDLDRLALTLFQRVTSRIAALSEDPRPRGSQNLSGVAAYRLRVGDQRVVYEIDDRARTIAVTRVRHRREVYRKLR